MRPKSLLLTAAVALAVVVAHQHVTSGGGVKLSRSA